MDASGAGKASLGGMAARGAAARVKQAAQMVLGMGLAAVAIVWGLPKLTDTTWSEIFQTLSQLSVGTALLCLLLMAGGLYSYTFTLAASLPGLGHVQALLANLTSSGVSDVLPGGAAMGAAVQYGMLRSWGFTHRGIGTSMIVTSFWNLLIRMLMPLGAVVWLVSTSDRDLPTVVVRGALIGGLLAAALSLVLVGILASRRAARAIGHVLNALARPIFRLLRRPHAVDVEALAMDVRARIIDVVRRGWVRLTLGLVGFLGLHFVLFWVCMLAFGINLSASEVFACYALSRLLTMVPLTPSGIGVTEVGPAALMVALGASGPAAAAAVFLFAIYSYGLEIPFGAVAAVVWAKTRGRWARPAPDEAPPATSA